LRDFGIDLNTRKIKIATNNRDISQKEFKNLVIQSISDVQNIYWDLVFKREDLKVKKQSLDLAKDFENRVRIQVDVGVLAPLEILQAQSEVAAREEAVIIAENEIKDLEDQLKTKLNFPPDAEEWNSTLVPADSPSFADEIFQLEEFLKIALENRPEMEELRLELDNEQIDIAYKKNQLYPTIDLVASFGLNGISGDAVAVTNQSTGLTQTTRFGGNYDRSLSRALSGDTYSYDIGLKFEYPIGNRASKSSLTASKLEVEKTLIEIKNQEQQITLEVKEAVREIETNVKRVNVTRVSKKLATEKMSAEEKKFEVGLSTSFKVLEFQKDLTEEQSKEIKAIIDYTKSIVNLYRVAGIALEKNNVELN
jgi:outer membrane protein TolC